MRLTLGSRTTSLAVLAALALSATTIDAASAETADVGISELSNPVGGVPFGLVAMVGSDFGPDSYTYTWTAGERCEVLGQEGATVEVLCDYVSGQDLDGPPREFAVEVSDGATLVGTATYGVRVQGEEIFLGHDNPDEDLVLRGTLHSYTDEGMTERGARDVEIEARWRGTTEWVSLATVQTEKDGRFRYRHYPLDRALDIRARHDQATGTIEGIKVRTQPRVSYKPRRKVAVVTMRTVFGAPVPGLKVRLYQYRWVKGKPRSTYLKVLDVKPTNERGKVRFEVPIWKPSPEYWVRLKANPEFLDVPHCFRIVEPTACG